MSEKTCYRNLLGCRIIRILLVTPFYPIYPIAVSPEFQLPCRSHRLNVEIVVNLSPLRSLPTNTPMIALVTVDLAPRGLSPLLPSLLPLLPNVHQKEGMLNFTLRCLNKWAGPSVPACPPTMKRTMSLPMGKRLKVKKMIRANPIRLT